MSNVIPFKSKSGVDKTPDEVKELVEDLQTFAKELFDEHEAILEEIDDAMDYQMYLKRFLEKEDYEAVVLGIMDPEYYAELEDDLRKMVDTYYAYDGVIYLVLIS